VWGLAQLSSRTLGIFKPEGRLEAMSFCTASVWRCNTKDTQTLLIDDKFLAYEEDIKIVPTFSTDEPFDFIKGKYGPFRAHSATKVPLWAALKLDRLQQCTIVTPDWLNEEDLKVMRDKEVQNPHDLEKVPRHYIELSHALLVQSKTFSNRIREKERIMTLLREIIEVRREKIMFALKALTLSNPEFNCSEMSAVEIGYFRTRSLQAIDKFLDFLKSRRVADMDEPDADMQEGTQQDDSFQDSSNPPPL